MLMTHQWILLTWIAFGKYLTVLLFEALDRTPAHTRVRVYDERIAARRNERDYTSWWLLPLDAILLYFLLRTNTLRVVPDTAASVAATFGLMILWTEPWMYWTHRWMHRNRWLWKWHSFHHLDRIPRPRTALSFSIGEKLLFYTLPWILGAVVMSYFLPITLGGIAFFYTWYYFTSPIAHSNAETSPPWLDALPLGLGRVLGSPTSHALHHGRYDKNYGFITTIFDRLHGTQWDDSDPMKNRARKGRALRSLGERYGDAVQHASTLTTVEIIDAPQHGETSVNSIP